MGEQYSGGQQTNSVSPTLPEPSLLLPSPSTERPQADALASALVVYRDGQRSEVSRYQQDGKVAIEGDKVTQQIGRGKTVEYDLAQLALHSNDAEYFANTMRYAAKRGDSVKIDVRDGVASVADRALESRLPQDMPLRDSILRASVKHDLDPVLLAAVGIQETNLGRSPSYNKTTHRGDVERDSPGGHGYGPFQLDDRTPGRSQAELERAARDPNYAADRAAGMLEETLKAQHGNVERALQQYNTGRADHRGAPTHWGGTVGTLYYADSTMRHYGEIVTAAQEQERARTAGRVR